MSDKNTANVATPLWDKDSNMRKPSFWVLHILGWFTYVLVFTMDNAIFMDKYNALGWQIFWPLLLSGVIAAVLTLPLRYIYQRCWAYSASIKVVLIIVCSLVAALLWTPLKNLVIWGYQHGMVWSEVGSDELPYYMLLMSVSYAFFMVLVWSSLYFGINYHYRLLDEQQQHLKAVRLSHVAQIRMLRYQINPHFLFNTLNAISTLVLKGAKEKANGMISRLSTFLRFSLDNDPESKVRLYEELKTLMLYLEIEKTRFDERLKVEFAVDAQAESVLMPSLLLQPLVENAIKYAISQMAEGGVIQISARLKQGQLELQVADNGPGANLENMQQKGVGLRNIRERLQVLYANRHQFKIEHNSPQGLKVCISIPLEAEYEPNNSTGH